MQADCPVCGAALVSREWFAVCPRGDGSFVVAAALEELLPAQGLRAIRLAGGTPTGRACPCGDGSLESLRVGRVRVERCAACGGAWLCAQRAPAPPSAAPDSPISSGVWGAIAALKETFAPLRVGAG